MTLSDSEFRLFQALIYREAGIHLGPAKRSLLVARLQRRLRALGLTSFGAYHRRVVESGADGELVALLDAVTTNETHFFREPRQFHYLEHVLVPMWRAERRDRRLRLWSAGCSTGQEPFSLAMTLRWALRDDDDWRVEILATDLSTRALDVARAAMWPIDRASEVPERFLKAFMLRGSGTHEGVMKASEPLRRLVRFERVNLHGPSWPATSGFDAIFCRNVLIYFDQASKTRVLERLAGRLAPGGYLFLGHAETLASGAQVHTGAREGLRAVAATIYRAGRSQGVGAMAVR